MKKDIDRYFKTSSFPLVNFLFAKGIQIEGIESVDRLGKKSFTFMRSERLEELINLYKFGDKSDADLLVQVHVYEQTRRELLERLND
jgi:hypothetical protein